MSDKPFTFDRTVRLLITVAVLVALFVVFRQLSSVLLPFLVSMFLAYLIYPIVTFVQYKMRFRSRILSVIFTLLVLFGVLVGIVALLVHPISSEVQKMSAIVSNYLGGINAETLLPLAWQEGLRDWLQEVNVVEILKTANISTLLEKLAPYVGGLLGSGVSLVMGLLVVFISILYLIFILIDYEKISEGIVHIVPQKYRALVSGIMTDLEVGMSKYFRGQALIASCGSAVLYRFLDNGSSDGYSCRLVYRFAEYGSLLAGSGYPPVFSVGAASVGCDGYELLGYPD